ncbi:MAG: NAD(P)-dependent oxidoreductase [Chitinophagales bacterium]
MTKVTFIGLGIMGSRMAKNLLKHQVKLTVFNRSSEAAKPLQEMGANIAPTAQEAVEGADIVFTMLSTPAVVESVAMGEKGFLLKMKKNALWVDFSTVNPSFTNRVLEAAQNQHVRFVAAPVAGTKPHAENAELVFFVGGEQANLDEVAPLLAMMGKKTMHIGEEVDKGICFKMLVNSMLAQSMLIFSETVVFGEKMGLSRDFLLKVLPNLVVSAPFTKAKAEMIQEENYEVQFPLEWMHKDLQLVTQTAYELNHPMYLANLSKELYANANKSGLGRMDFAAIHEFMSRQ